MPKLTTLKPRLKPMGNRLSTMSQTRDTDLGADAKVRGWYRSKRWRDLRIEILARDLFTCQRTGILLHGKAPSADSPVIHHRIPHRGEASLFWDRGNLIAVSKAWHDSEGKKEDRTSEMEGWF